MRASIVCLLVVSVFVLVTCTFAEKDTKNVAKQPVVKKDENAIKIETKDDDDKKKEKHHKEDGDHHPKHPGKHHHGNHHGNHHKGHKHPKHHKNRGMKPENLHGILLGNSRNVILPQDVTNHIFNKKAQKEHRGLAPIEHDGAHSIGQKLHLNVKAIKEAMGEFAKTKKGHHMLKALKEWKKGHKETKKVHKETKKVHAKKSN